MTRNVARRPVTPVGLIRQRHGHKRKGNPVEAWKMDLEQDENPEEGRIRGVHLNAIEQIADGVERMMFSWNLDRFERGQEHAKIFNASAAARSEALPPACTAGDDEERSSLLNEDSGKACTVCHQFSTQQVTAKVAGPACTTHNTDLLCPRNPRVFGTTHHHGENFHTSRSPSLGQGFPGVAKFDNRQDSYTFQVLSQRNDWKTNNAAENNSSIVDTRVLEIPGHPSVTIRQDRMSGGTVLEIRRDSAGSVQISTCEKNVGTEGRNVERAQTMAEFSPQLSFRGLTPSPDAQTPPPSPSPERNCYHIKEDSCPCPYPSFSSAQHQLDASSRKDETLTSTLTHSCSNFTHSRSETDNKLDKVTCEDQNCKKRRAISGGFPNYCLLHCSSDYSPGHGPHQTGINETQLEVGGRPVTMPALRDNTEALQKKFKSLINVTSDGPLVQGKERSCSVPPEISSVEELQLALIECATEFEIKTLDARMKMHELRAHKWQIASCDFDRPADSQEIPNHDEMSTCDGAKRLEPKIVPQQVKKHVFRPEEMKENIKRLDTQPWKKKERSSPELKKSESGIRAFSRLFDRQRRSLDDALHRVDRLQREVVKKDRELVEWQLKEKQTKAQLHGLEGKEKKARLLQATAQLEPRKLFIELPALRESLRSFKTEEHKQISSPSLAETAQELSENKSMSDMSEQGYSLHTRLQCVEERTSEMDELKATMSKLASNMAELSLAFKDHVQFVNHRLAAIHGFVSRKKLPAKSLTSPELVPQVPQRNGLAQLKLAALDTVEAEREITRSPTPSWQR